MQDVKKIFGVLTVAAAFTCGGCDQVSSILEGLSGKKQVSREDPAAGQERRPSPSGVVSRSAAESHPKKTPPDFLARVGDRAIGMKEFEERLQAVKKVLPDFDPSDPERRRAVLEEWIRQQLLVQEALRRGVDRDPKVARALEDAKNLILVREMVRRIAGEEAVSEIEAKEYYDAHKKDFADPVEWRVRELVVKDEDTAKQVLIEAYQGADFAELVKKYSKGRSAWKDRGDLGWLKVLPFPKMRDVVRALEPGQISSVFKGPEGYYLVKLEGKKGGEPKPFTEIKEDIVAGLRVLRQQQKLEKALEELRQRTEVFVNDKVLSEEGQGR